MALVDEQNLRLYRSGDECIGGPRSAVLMGAQPGDLFADVSAAQAAAGLTQHRCVYLRSDDPNPEGLLDGVLYIVVPTLSAGTELDIGLAPEGLGGVAELLAGEEVAPAGVAFTRPHTPEDAIVLPTPIVEGDEIAIWLRRTVEPGAASPSELDYGVLALFGRSVA